jgi:hypothetical protein
VSWGLWRFLYLKARLLASYPSHSVFEGGGAFSVEIQVCVIDSLGRMDCEEEGRERGREEEKQKYR